VFVTCPCADAHKFSSP
jgi:hypothetical protein